MLILTCNIIHCLISRALSSYFAALERQQLEADVRKLTKEKKDLLDQLKYCKDDLKTKEECEIVTVYMHYLFLQIVYYSYTVCFRCQY